MHITYVFVYLKRAVLSCNIKSLWKKKETKVAQQPCNNEYNNEYNNTNYIWLEYDVKLWKLKIFYQLLKWICFLLYFKLYFAVIVHWIRLSSHPDPDTISMRLVFEDDRHNVIPCPCVSNECRWSLNLTMLERVTFIEITLKCKLPEFISLNNREKKIRNKKEKKKSRHPYLGFFYEHSNAVQ